MWFRSTVWSGDFVRALVVCAAFLLPLNTAAAASCSGLKAELRRLESGSASSSPAARKWTTARSQQQKAITAAERDARYLGCASAATPNCQSLNGKIRRMKANLSAIERQLAKAGGGSSGNAKRLRQVRSQLAGQNCNAPASARQAQAEQTGDQDKPRSLLSRLFNPRSQPEQRSKATVDLASARSGDREIAAVRAQKNSGASRVRLPSGGTFRTLCVRTCDGYFFPLSFSAGKDQFGYDEARCSEICPAAQTELYVYRNPGGDQSQMISLAGALYSEQPYADRYKSEFVEGCSCRPTRQSRMRSDWTELTSGSGDRVFFADISAGLPRRTLQPPRGGTFEDNADTPSPLSRPPLRRAQLPSHEDPDTLINLEKGFDVTVPLHQAAVRLSPDQDRPTGPSVTVNGLPLLSVRALAGDGAAMDSPLAPVFKSNDTGFRPAPGEKASVRVVGPEYFVAQ
ncbi:DUF2865 domain-containing protein [Roseibium marinum]|uniref:Uncharacterized protein DUF2865 n=1 Tax=Roseibium marinum TaxID=281252 RepID=A0A2S3UMD5_9HYPH|nr:DUF2865 domain-containing protein [Roseibium marinum]POF28855.1 uncharacterized protein DUF2865 [Roseibium marinum]